jgi:hypothetical protein
MMGYSLKVSAFLFAVVVTLLAQWGRVCPLLYHFDEALTRVQWKNQHLRDNRRGVLWRNRLCYG